MARKLILVWDHDSPGMKVWVVRGWFQDFVNPKHFSGVGETSFKSEGEVRAWKHRKSPDEMVIEVDRTLKRR